MDIRIHIRSFVRLSRFVPEEPNPRLFTVRGCVQAGPDPSGIAECAIASTILARHWHNQFFFQIEPTKPVHERRFNLGPSLGRPKAHSWAVDTSPWGMAQGRFQPPGKWPIPRLKLHRNEEDKAVCSPQETSLPKDLPKFQEDFRIRRFHTI